MKNLILGSSGFLGQRLCNYLKEIGQLVIEFDIKNNQKQDARCAKLSLGDIDRVYFLAWDVGGAKYLYNNDSQNFQMEWNSALMNNIFPQLKNTPFVFVSSQLSENVDTVYGVQKRYGEVWTKLSQSGVCVRLWNLYGYNEDYTQRSHVVSDFVYQAMSLNKIDMLTDGEELRQFIHIDDVCSGLIKSFDINNRNETYDISNGIWVKLLDVAKLIQKYTGCQINIGNKKGETVYIQNKNYVPNWKPTVTLENGLKKMIESFKNVQ